MRSVQVVEQSSGNITRAEHVIGVDESGDMMNGDPFALTAVRAPREFSERLAELLIENDLAPWRAKSSTITHQVSFEERDQQVENFIQDLAEEEAISHRTAVGYTADSIHHKAAGICALAKKTITSSSEYSGDAVLLPDGATSMYGESQTHLRTQAAQFFDGGFQSAFGEVYVSGLPKADLTYPEVTAADYIASYLRTAFVESGNQLSSLPDGVVWFDSNWREPNISPLSFYQIHGVSGDYGAIEKTRAAGWIKGRHPNGGEFNASSQWNNTVEMLESDLVQQYLLKNIAP